jgi:hypothetical protein
VTRAAREDRESAHERAADAEDVDVHKPVVPRGRILQGMGAQRSGRNDRLQRTLL